jgi:hypothetical protein
MIWWVANTQVQRCVREQSFRNLIFIMVLFQGTEKNRENYQSYRLSTEKFGVTVTLYTYGWAVADWYLAQVRWQFF